MIGVNFPAGIDRPLGIGEIVDRSVTLTVQRWRTLLLLVLVEAVPVGIARATRPNVRHHSCSSGSFRSGLAASLDGADRCLHDGLGLRAARDERVTGLGAPLLAGDGRDAAVLVIS